MSATTNARVKNKLLIDKEVYLVCATTWFQEGWIASKIWGFYLKKTQLKPEDKTQKPNPEKTQMHNKPQQTTKLFSESRVELV